MKREHVFIVFVLFLSIVFFYLLYQILSPFLESILWAILLAIVFYPVFSRLQRLLKKKATLSALIMTALVIVVIVLPVSFLIASLVNELTGAYHKIQEMIETGRLQAYFEQAKDTSIFKWMLMKLNQRLDLTPMGGPIDFLLKNLREISTFLLNQSTKILKGLSTFLIGFFFTLLSLYYFFKDGNHLFGRLKEAIPLPAGERDLLIRRFKEMTYATIYGGIVVGIIQGILGGMAFWILGLPSPILWGTSMAMLSFIPFGGTALIWLPASVILLIQAQYVRGIILLAVGTFGISLVDNFLRPLLIGSRTNIHPLLLFFAVLGGIQAFGPIGLITGPLVASLCLSLIELYARDIKPDSHSNIESHP